MCFFFRQGSGESWQGRFDGKCEKFGTDSGSRIGPELRRNIPGRYGGIGCERLTRRRRTPGTGSAGAEPEARVINKNVINKKNREV